MKGRTARLHRAGDQAFATRGHASLAFAVIDAEGVLKIPKLPIGLAVIAQRGSSGGNRLGQHIADDRHKAGHLSRFDITGQPQRADLRPEKHLADIDIAQTRDVVLVKKG